MSTPETVYALGSVLALLAVAAVLWSVARSAARRIRLETRLAALETAVGSPARPPSTRRD